MDCDVAVLGGGPGGYTAAIRAAQLGARASASTRSRARRHLSAHRLHPDQGLGADRLRDQGGRAHFAKLGVKSARSSTSRQPTSGRRASSSRWSTALRASSRRTASSGSRAGAASRTRTRSRSRAGGRDLQERGRRDRFVPLRPPIEGLDSARCGFGGSARADGGAAGSSSSAAGSSAASSRRSSTASA